MKHACKFGCVAMVLASCHTTPYDFPQPTMIANERGYSMTGFMATDDPEVVRERLRKRMVGLCPEGVDFVDLTTRSGENMMGTKIFYYEAIMKCYQPQQSAAQ